MNLKLKRLALPFLAALLSFSGTCDGSTVPYQYIAKLYTEGLGRAPDIDGWNARVSYFLFNTCTAATVKYQGKIILTSSEFLSLYPNTNPAYGDNEARVIVLYRLILNREPDRASLESWADQLDAHPETWEQVIDSFYATSEFSIVALQICATSESYGFNGSYSVPVTNRLNYKSGAQVQAELNALPEYGVLQLPLRTVVQVSSGPIVVTGHKTLTTQSNYFAPADPDGKNRQRYAQMARIVRMNNSVDNPQWNSNPSGALVQLEKGAKLQYIWTDGRRTDPAIRHGTTECTRVNGVLPSTCVKVRDVNVEVGVVNTLDGLDHRNNSDVVIDSCRASEPAGGSHVALLGSANTAVNSEQLGYTGFNCTNVKVRNNLLTGYTTSHSSANDGTPEPWADGITNFCQDAEIYGNHVIDATDISIVTFHAGGLFGNDYKYGLCSVSKSECTPGDPLDGCPSPQTCNPVTWELATPPCDLYRPHVYPPGHSAGTPIQSSKVHDNTVLSAGNSAFAAVSADAWQRECVADLSFSSMRIERNYIWTGGAAHFDIGINLGNRSWTGEHNSNTGAGPVVNANYFSGATSMNAPGVTNSINVKTGIAVNGLRGVTLTSNYGLSKPNACADPRISLQTPGFTNQMPAGMIVRDSANSYSSISQNTQCEAVIAQSYTGGVGHSPDQIDTADRYVTLPLH